MHTDRNAPQLSDLEWSIVAAALDEAHRRGCTSAGPASGDQGIFARMAAGLFKRGSDEDVADPRLEAIRSFVCANGRKQASSAELATALARHGFSPAQIAALALLSA